MKKFLSDTSGRGSQGVLRRTTTNALPSVGVEDRHSSLGSLRSATVPPLIIHSCAWRDGAHEGAGSAIAAMFGPTVRAGDPLGRPLSFPGAVFLRRARECTAEGLPLPDAACTSKPRIGAVRVVHMPARPGVLSEREGGPACGPTRAAGATAPPADWPGARTPSSTGSPPPMARSTTGRSGSESASSRRDQRWQMPCTTRAVRSS